MTTSALDRPPPGRAPLWAAFALKRYNQELQKRLRKGKPCRGSFVKMEQEGGNRASGLILANASGTIPQPRKSRLGDEPRDAAVTSTAQSSYVNGRKLCTLLCQLQHFLFGWHPRFRS
uniref:Nuclear protein MDM1 n=1 Tax=Trichuris muris TaxID=70415 RepID=A0A5S6R592_TRIMR